jgi:hypothetical protein
VDSEAEHLRENAGYPVSHDRRTVGDLIQQLDDFARLDRAGVAAAPAREHIRIEDPLDVFRPPALAFNVARHELVGQMLDRVPWWSTLGWFVGLQAWRDGEAGTPWVDTAAEEGARRLGALVRLSQARFRPHAEHEARSLAVPVEAPVPGFRAGVRDPELQSGARGIINFVPVVPCLERFHATTCQPCNVPEWSHSGPFWLQLHAS